jgi:dihydrodipicolinate synthase/N-acetylneuraminate lyase
VKAGVEMLGFEVGKPRLPLVPVSDALRTTLREEMDRLGLLARAG